MCKYLINEVVLGKRTVGFEVYSSETQDIIGMTEKQVKDSLLGGKTIKGFNLSNEGNIETDREFCKNIMVKSGIGTLSAKFETDSIANIMYTVVGKKNNGMEVVSSRFYRGVMSEDKIKILYEMGAVNGVYIDTKGKVRFIEENKNIKAKTDSAKVVTDKASDKKAEVI